MVFQPPDILMELIGHVYVNVLICIVNVVCDMFQKHFLNELTATRAAPPQ